MSAATTPAPARRCIDCAHHREHDMPQGPQQHQCHHPLALCVVDASPASCKRMRHAGACGLSAELFLERDLNAAQSGSQLLGGPHG